ncbi:MAG: hypothetical protein H0W88_07595 [Parachlamydiaceae bacterium]|nr:hypothetical protein [Parachlamydiaceae bacterium]
MFKNLWRTSLIFLGLFLCSQDLSAATAFPDEFYVRERWVSATTSFDIESKYEKLGTVHRKFFSLMPEYHLKNADQEMVAKARMRFWSFGAIFDVEDGQAQPLGTVEQRFSWFYPTFEIVSASHQKLARAQLNFWGTKYEIKDVGDDHIIATLTRPFFQFKNNWTIQIKDHALISQKNIHPNLFLVIIAFQVDRENWRRSQNKRNNNNNIFGSHEFELNSVEREQAPYYVQELKNNLELYQSTIIGSDPVDEDFSFIENLAICNETDNCVEDDSNNYKKFKELIELLNSDELTASQKAALYLMLEQRLEDCKISK